MPPFEALWHKTEREKRQQELFPELRLADFNSTFEVDRLRREEGREPTSLGRATESAWMNDQSEDAAPRGAFDTPSFLGDPDAQNPFLRMQAEESERRFQTNAQLGSLDPLSALGTMFGGISHNLDRPAGFLRAALEEGGPAFSLNTMAAGIEGLKRPEDFRTREILRRKGVGDEDLPGLGRLGLSAADVLGGVGDFALDPLNLLGGGAAKAASETRAARVLGRGAKELALSERAALDLTEESGETALSKLTSTIRSAKPLQEQNKELLHQFRQRQAGAFAGTFQPGTGEEGFTRGLSALRGQAERVTFEPLRPLLAQEDIDGFVNAIGTSSLRPFEQVGAGTALRNILDGQVPTPSDLVELEKVFPGVVKSLRGAGIINGPAFTEYVRDILSLPGSIVSSFDISGTRQVATYAAGHPVSFAKQFRRSLNALRSERGFAAVQSDLANRWYAPLRETAGVALADAERGLSKGEGTFISTVVNKVPGYRASQRQYAALLNLSRDDLFAKMLQSYGGDLKAIPEAELKRWGKFVNIATGRGTALDFLTGNQIVGQPLLWAPRLYASRMQFPFELLSASPTVRKEAARQLVSFVGINSALLAAGKAAGVWDVELNPRSADFGQIRIGPQRIDLWAGFRPFVNLTARLITGERKSTNTGELTKVDRKTIMADFARSKLSPIVATGVNLWTGEDLIGKPFGWKDAPESLLGPLFGRDLVEAVKNMGPMGLPGALAAGLGAGVTTYEESPFDALARQRGFPSYAKAPGYVKNEIEAAMPAEAKALSDERLARGGSTAAFERAALERNSKYAAIQTETPEQRQVAWDLMRKAEEAYRAQRDALEAEHPDRRVPSRDPREQALNAYFDAYVKLPDGSTDYDATEAVQAALAEKWTPAQREYVETYTGAIDPALPPAIREMKQLSRDLADSGLYEIRDKTWASFRVHPAAKNFESAREYEAYLRKIVMDQFGPSVPESAKLSAADSVVRRDDLLQEYAKKLNAAEMPWIVANPELADRAISWRRFKPTKEQQAMVNYKLAQRRGNAPTTGD